MPTWLACRLCNISIHLFLSFYIMSIIVNSVYPIGCSVHNDSEQMVLWKEIKRWMPSDFRHLSMRVNSRKAITELDCFLPKVRLHLVSEHYRFWPTHRNTHLIPYICFVFGKGTLSFLRSPYLSKLDAGSGCLTASVKLWCGCLILGSMHLKVFIIMIFKKGRGDQLNGGTWFSSSDHWCVEDGWRVLDRDLESPISNHTFQRNGSAWLMIFIEERKLKEACHCCHLMVFVYNMMAPTSIWHQLPQSRL